MSHTAQTARYADAGNGVWQWCNILSADAALVAIVWQQWLHPTGLAPALVLGLSVWLVYCADHWLDARKLSHAQLLTPRHRFAKEHSRTLLICWGLVFAANLTLALSTLSRSQLIAGCTLLLPCAVYIACVHLRQQNIPKELIVATIFAGGAVVFQTSSVPPLQLAAPATGLFLLAFANCTLIARKEMRTDADMGFGSLAQRLPAMRTYARAALLIAALLGITLFFSGSHHAIALSLCAVGLLALEHVAERLSQERFRQLADAILLLPILFLPVLLQQ